MARAYQKIVPHLWYDKEAREAADFYASVFPESRVTHAAVLPDTPSGDCDVVSFEVWGQRFMAISAGPLFRFNPSISFIVNFDPSRMKDARTALDGAWAKLADGGKPLMPLDKYPFSERYGWMEDRFGLSWQLILTDPAGDPRPPIVPSLMFVGKRCGQAEPAIDFYKSVFRDAKTGLVVRYGPGQAPEKEGTLMFADFQLLGQWFAAMDSAREHRFDFNEAVSLLVSCDSQEEIDYYWEKLSAVPEAEQCGWLKDKFGVSWQVAPAAMEDMMSQATPQQMKRLTEAFLPMKKFDLAKLEAAYKGK
jgi:predicted 3-demethylubiquinone-9 3-methyltransferase (glyoxalase superfamily)